MKLYIHTMMGQRWAIEGLDEASTVRFLKRMIRIKCGLDLDRQVLTHHRRVLADHETLAGAGLAAHQSLQLTLLPVAGLR